MSGAKRKRHISVSSEEDEISPEDIASMSTARKSSRVRKPNPKYGSTEFITSIGMDLAKRQTPTDDAMSDGKSDSAKGDSIKSECGNKSDIEKDDDDKCNEAIDANKADEAAKSADVPVGVKKDNQNPSDGGRKENGGKKSDTKNGNNAKKPSNRVKFNPNDDVDSSDSSDSSEMVDLNKHEVNSERSTPSFLNRFQLSPSSLANGHSKSSPSAPNNGNNELDEDEEEVDEEEEEEEEEEQQEPEPEQKPDANEINFSMSTPSLNLTVYVPADLSLKASVVKEGKNVIVRFDKH